MNKKKVGVIASACAACAVCASVIVGTTYALFTDNDKVDISVTAGTVKVSAEVDKSSVQLTSMNVKQDGNSWANGGTAGFNAQSELELSYITPGDAATFNINVKNESTVNIQYRINWQVTGDLANVLVATANVVKFGYWTEWTVPQTDEEKVKTISVTVELPEGVEEYQGAEASISFAIEAIQGNAEVKNEVASVNGTAYKTLTEALAAAQDGDTVNLLRNEGSDEVTDIVIDKNVTIAGNGEAAFKNTHFAITENAAVTFDKVNFSGDSYVNVGGASALNMKGCVATNVSPSKVDNCDVKGFIVSDETKVNTKLNLVGNTITVVNEDVKNLSAPIFLWSYVADSVIASNTFGSEENPCVFYAVKTLNAVDGATLILENNVVYGTAQKQYRGDYYFMAFQFCQNTSINNAFTVLSSNNTIIATSNGDDDLRAFAIGANSGKKNFTLIDNGTTLNGKTISCSNIDIDDGNYYLYINLNGDEKLSTKISKVSTVAELSAALSNANITNVLLGGDLTVESTLNVARNVTIDLNGYTITKTASTNGSNHLIAVASGVTATIKNGNIVDTHEADKAWGYAIDNRGDLTLENMNISSHNNSSSLIHNGYAALKFVAEGAQDAKLTINGGNYYADEMCVIKADMKSETIINDGYFNCASGYTVECYGKLTVNGGNFASEHENGTALLINGGNMDKTQGVKDYAYADVTINGGDFTNAAISVEAGNGLAEYEEYGDYSALAGAVKVLVNGGNFNNVIQYGENALIEGDSFVVAGGEFADTNFPEWVTVQG